MEQEFLEIIRSDNFLSNATPIQEASNNKKSIISKTCIPSLYIISTCTDADYLTFAHNNLKGL
jgi:hypothetical protein